MRNELSGIVRLGVLSAFCAAVYSAAMAETKPLESVAAAELTVRQSRILDGRIEAINQSTVSAQTSGSIEALGHDVGDVVEAGSVIARIKSRTQQAGLQQAEASVGEAQAAVQRAEAAWQASVASAREVRANFNRVRQIYAEKLVSRAEYDRANAALQSADAQVNAQLAALEAARASVAAATARQDQAGEELSWTEVIAPYSGVVTARHVELGELVAPGSPIMSGISLAALRVATDVPQSMAPAVRAYNLADVLLDDGTRIPLASLTLFPYADPASNTFHVRGNLPPGSEGLYPGMRVKVEFTVGERERLQVPITAVVSRGELSAVYVLGEAGALRLRQVRTGERVADQSIIILSGLEAGEQVATDPAHATLLLKQRQLEQAAGASAPAH